MDRLFLPISGYEGYYAISEDGVVISLSRRTSHGHRRKKKVLNICRGPSGYQTVQLCKKGKAISHRVHRLVAITFLPNPHRLPDVHHRDHNKTNNRVENLRWVTPTENMREASVAGRLDGVSRGVGRKLTLEQIQIIQARLERGDSHRAIAEDFKVSRRNINYVANRKIWTGSRCIDEGVNR